MATKNFKEDFYKFYNKLKNKEPFSFCKFSDGELFILQNKEVILGPNPQHHGYMDDSDHKHFDPNQHQKIRELLFQSFRYKAPNYYIGICAPSDQDDSTFFWMKNESGQPEENLTWANLMVNSNYKLFCDLMVPEFSNHEIILVCNQKSKIKDLPFKVKKDFRVGANCIVNDLHLLEAIPYYMEKENINNHVFLFCCSSLGNFLCHELYKRNPNNTYIDLGSTLNPYLGLAIDRGYLAAAKGVLWRGYQDTSADLSRDEIWK